MKKMIHKVDGQTYEGFRRFRFKHKRIPKAIAVATVDNMDEVWEVDPRNLPLATDELRRYYRAEDDMRDVDILIYTQAHLFLVDDLEPLVEETTDGDAEL